MATEFIPQTLESLLYQTMKDFEVVVVDDCSTDNSVEVVESFKPRFNGRLHVIKLPKNTGTPGLPRNVGIQLSRGKYIAFLDSDDLFTLTALEELSTLAEKFQADVVHSDYWFQLYGNREMSENNSLFTDMKELLNPKNFSFHTDKRTPPLNNAMLETTDLSERVRRWVNWDYHWGTPSLFCKRNFLIVNQITFPIMLMSEDMLVNFNCLCLASRYLRVPNATYITRPRTGSMTRAKNNVQKEFHLWLSVLNIGFKEFERIMDKIKFFNEHSDYRYAVLDFYFWRMFDISKFLWSYHQIPVFSLNDLVRKEFHTDDAAFSAYLFNTVNIQRLQIMRLQQELAKFKKQ